MVYLLLKMWMFPIGGIPHPFQDDQNVCPIGGGISWVNCAKRLVQLRIIDIKRAAAFGGKALLLDSIGSDHTIYSIGKQADEICRTVFKLIYVFDLEY